MSTVVTQSFLLVISQVAGIFLLVATMLLIGLRRIYIDKETQQPIEFEFPLIGKVKTQVPALFLILAGFTLVAYPIQKGGPPDQAIIQGEVSAQGKPVTVLVLAVPQQYQTTIDSQGPFSMNVPLVGDGNYRVKYEIDRRIVADQLGILSNKVIKLKPVEYVPPESLEAQPIKGVPDATLQALGIK